MSEQQDLFAGDKKAQDQAKRDRLHARGWRQAGGQVRGRLLWRMPDGLGLQEEEDAFAWLARVEAEEAGRG